MAPAQAWVQALSATLAISVIPTAVLPFMPASASVAGGGVQSTLLSFAVGGLLGDVLLHLLPHLFASGGHHSHADGKALDVHGEGDFHGDEHSHGEDHFHGDGHSHGGHSHGGHTHGEEGAHGDEGTIHGHGWGELSIGLTIVAGYLFFFACERALRAATGNGHGHSHGGGGGRGDDVGRRKKDDDHAGKAGDNGGAGFSWGRLRISGVLNLAADALHNLTDGLAIGAAFAAGGSRLGVGTMLATLLHELPHEIGDYTVLVQSGFTKWQAIGAQFCTAIAAFAGAALGLVATGCEGMEQVLLAFTAGGFLYVAGSLIPEILDGPPPTALRAAGEMGAMATGVALMAGVALLEQR